MTATREDLKTHLSHDLGMTKKDADKVIDSFLEFIMSANEAGEKVQLNAFGSFEPHYRKGRIGTNPSTGEPIQLQSTVAPFFKPYKAYRDRIRPLIKTMENK